MTKKKSGQCVNCNFPSTKLTKDHLLPKAWYPTTTPKNFNKPTFPSCEDCNRSHGQSEERLLRSLGMSFSPGSVKAPGIAERVIHSMSMTEEADKQKAEIKGRVKMKFLKSTLFVPEGHRTALNLLPGMDVDEKLLEAGSYHASQIEGADIKRFACKIVRGVTYLQYRLFIEDSQEIIPTPQDQPFFAFANQRRELPGLIINFGAYPNEESPALLFVLRLWNQLTIRVLCLHRDDLEWRDTVLNRKIVTPLWQ